MKKIITLLLLSTVSVFAQIQMDWSVKIRDVMATPNQLLSMRDELLIGYSGAVLIDFSRFNDVDLDGDGLTDPLTRWVWISSKGEIIYRAINNDRVSPNLIMGGVVMFDDECIVITERFVPTGYLSFYKVEGSKLVKTKTEFAASSWVGFSNLSRFSSMFNGNGRPYVLGLRSATDESGKLAELARYSIQTKSPTFWVQQSEDLETWKDVIEVPQGESPKEFFRIKPEN